jgi:hypothetical protein
VNNGASVIGRLLARNGQISLINDVLDDSRCTTGCVRFSPRAIRWMARRIDGGTP